MTPEVILGPPGTGKTTAIMQLVEEELGRGVRPDRVACLTFTRRAAEEVVTRACAKFSLLADQLPHFRTLHSLCFRLLGLRGGDVLEGKTLQQFAEWVGVKITGRQSEDGTTHGFERGDRMIFMENLARTRMRPLGEQHAEDDDGLRWSDVSWFSRSLQQHKQQHGLHDYTDMLLEVLQQRLAPQLDVLLVDEAQDLSLLQWRVVELLAASCRRVVLVADDDQCIFRWAGADSNYIVDLPGVPRVLDQSFRVPPAIQALAAGIIAEVRHRRPKKWRARAAAGRVARVPDLAHVALEEQWGEDGRQPILILARNTYVLREQVEPELRRQGIIYERGGKVSISADLMEVVQDWEALRAGREVLVASARRIYEWMTAGRGYARAARGLPGFGEDEVVTMVDLRSRGGLLVQPVIWHEALDRLPRDEVGYIIAARRRGEKLRQRPRVRVSTIHAAKGGEAEHVVLYKEVARRTWRELERDPESEARVWYVGATRAREQLTIVESQTRQACPWL